MYEYHTPVLLRESIEGLAIDPRGIYVDATFGGGGHASEILGNLGSDGQLYAFDQDQDAARNDSGADPRLTFIASNFQYISRFLKVYGIFEVDGILADLGVSSYQFDTPERGFSFRHDGPLDMRMNQGAQQTAAEILQKYNAEALQLMLSHYGEVRNARSLATRIVEYRSKYPMRHVSDLLAAVEPLIKGQKNRYLAQVFQALRIEVNKELDALAELLRQSLSLLKPGGRLVVISYHSAEDRLVKRFLKTGNPEGVVEKDFYGRIYRPFKVITKKAIVPSEEEIGENSRARSARLRIGERMNDSSKDSPNTTIGG